MKQSFTKWWLWMGLIAVVLAFFAPASASFAGRELEIDFPSRCAPPR